MEIETLTRKWGNSIAIIIPSMLAEQEKIMVNERVAVKIEKKKKGLRELFGAHKFSKPIDIILKESDKELYDE